MFVLLIAVVAAGLLAGCGAGKPSKADYVKRANAVCQSEKKQMDELSERSTGSLQAGVQESVRIKEETLAKLRDIKQPSASATPTEWLRHRRLALNAAKEFLTTGPRSRARLLANSRYFQADHKAGEIARTYGMTACVGFAAS